MPAFPRSPARRLRFAAFSLLILGWLAAILVYLMARHSAGDLSAGDGTALEPSSQELFQLERMGGKSAVLILYFQNWVASLWHGQRLAYTLATLTTAVALLCLHIADLIDEV